MTSEPTGNAIDITCLRAALKGQYHAALAMLRQAIQDCPDDLWFSREPRNAYWQVAYHALFFAHFYLMPEESAFRPWEGHQSNVQHPDGIPGRADPTSSLPLIPRPYTKAEALAYWMICDEMVDEGVDALDLTSANCGFSWYTMPKLDHQILNIRHIQHHTAQLADRLRAATDAGTRWVGGRRT
jgi:DinB superfamily